MKRSAKSRIVLAMAALAWTGAAQALPIQARLDLGVALCAHIDTRDKSREGRNADAFLDELPVLPLPEAGIYAQGILGSFKLGLGLRAFSLIAETIVWPDAIAEYDTGRFAFEARLGGGCFAAAGIRNKADFGAVVVPDFSAWYRLRREGASSVGLGMTGPFVPQLLGRNLLLLAYVGLKAELLP